MPNGLNAPEHYEIMKMRVGALVRRPIVSIFNRITRQQSGGKNVHYRLDRTWPHRRLDRSSNIVDNGGKGPLLDMVLGIVGAVVGGAIFNALGAVPVTGFNLYSLFVAVVGAVVVLVVYHALLGRRRI